MRKIKKDKSVIVLLLEDVLNVGNKGDVKKVKLGYARFLISKNKAIVITKENKEKLEKLKLIAEEREKENKEKLEKLKEKIESLVYNAKLKIGEHNEVYNSISKTDIKNFLRSQDILVDKSDINLEKPIKELGEYNVEIDLGYNIKGNLKIIVEKE
ncbi:MAG: 50S ribosomal protein L9 [Minisyncoccia bacterium]